MASQSLSFQYVENGVTQAHTVGSFGYTYDTVGRLVRVDYPDGHIRTQAWDSLGRLS